MSIHRASARISSWRLTRIDACASSGRLQERARHQDRYGTCALAPYHLPQVCPCRRQSPVCCPRAALSLASSSHHTLSPHKLSQTLRHWITSLHSRSQIDHSKIRICLCSTLCFDMVQHSRKLSVCVWHFHLLAVLKLINCMLLLKLFLICDVGE